MSGKKAYFQAKCQLEIPQVFPPNRRISMGILEGFQGYFSAFVKIRGSFVAKVIRFSTNP